MEHSSSPPPPPAVPPRMRASASTTNFISFVDTDLVPPSADPLSPAGSSHGSCPNLSSRVPSGGASHAESARPAPAPRQSCGSPRQAPSAGSPVMRYQPRRSNLSSSSSSPLKMRMPSPAQAAQLVTADSLTALPVNSTAGAAVPQADGFVTPRRDPLLRASPDAGSHGRERETPVASVISSSNLAPPSGPAAGAGREATRPAVDADPPSHLGVASTALRSEDEDADLDVWKSTSSEVGDDLWATAVSAILPDESGDVRSLPPGQGSPDPASGATHLPAEPASGSTAAATSAATGQPVNSAATGAFAYAPARGGGAAHAGAERAAEIAEPAASDIAGTASVADPPPHISVAVLRPPSMDTASSLLPVSYVAAVASRAGSAPSEPTSTAPSAPLDCFMPLPYPDTSPTPSYAAGTPPSTVVSDSSIVFPALPEPRNTARMQTQALAAGAAAGPPTPVSPGSDSSAPGPDVSFVYAAFPDLPPQVDATAPQTAASAAEMAPQSSVEHAGSSGALQGGTEPGPAGRPVRSRLLARVNSSGTIRTAAQDVLGAIRRTFSRRRSMEIPAALPALQPPQSAPATPPPRPRSQFFKSVHESFMTLEGDGSQMQLTQDEDMPSGSAPRASASSLQSLMCLPPPGFFRSQLPMSQSEGVIHPGSSTSSPAATAPVRSAGSAPHVGTIQSAASPQPSPRGRRRFVHGPEGSRRARSERPAHSGLSRRSARLGRLSACFCVPEL